ncbi:hypothetical protein [Staphylococcus phage SpP]|nr:hypothetical protein [Staphylococcus arlettae]
MTEKMVVVRALHQFLYLKDDGKYEYIDIDRELEIDIKRAIQWARLGNVDVLNPYLNEGLEKYELGFDEYEKEVGTTWH